MSLNADVQTEVATAIPSKGEFCAGDDERSHTFLHHSHGDRTSGIYGLGHRFHKKAKPERRSAITKLMSAISWLHSEDLSNSL
jgi:hypothetical protein